MKIKTYIKIICISLIASLVNFSNLDNAIAKKTKPEKQKIYFCEMKGTWIDTAGKEDYFTFFANYLSKNGPDYFAGKYVNPGDSEADIIGITKSNIWEILFTYTDNNHKNMTIKAIGKGERIKHGTKNNLSIEGSYKMYLSSNDIQKDGRFKLNGKCSPNK